MPNPERSYVPEPDENKPSPLPQNLLRESVQYKRTVLPPEGRDAVLKRQKIEPERTGSRELNRFSSPGTHYSIGGRPKRGKRQ